MPEPVPLSEPELTLTDKRAGQYLIFRLAHGEFGVPIHKIHEVMEMQEITWVPNAPAFITGVINLRGKVIPVINLRPSFELPSEAPTPHTCIVVVRVVLASSDQILGILVDTVTEVISLKPEEFLEPEELQGAFLCGNRDSAPYLIGTARINNKAKLLLDIDEVLNNLDPRNGPVLSTAA